MFPFFLFSNPLLGTEIEKFFSLQAPWRSMDQPGKVANPALGQLTRENEYSPIPVRA